MIELAGVTLHRYQTTLGQRLIIDFVVVASDLWLYVLDTLVKRGAELITDYYLVVSWIRWLPDRPRTPKRVVRANWERLVETPHPSGLQLPPL